MRADEVKAELESIGAEAFRHRYGRYYLVLTESAALDDVASFVDTASRYGHDVVNKRKLPEVDIRPILLEAPGKLDGRVTIGRDRKSDIYIPHPRVSSLHACFTLAGGLLSLSDAGSKNGTGVNGARLAAYKNVPVDVGDTIRFGPVSATIWGVDDVVAAVRSGF
jgi:hypothetical protein